MSEDTWLLFLYSALAVFATLLLFRVSDRSARATRDRLRLSEHRYYTFRRLVRMLHGVLLVLALALIWGVNLRYVWVSVTSLLAMIAIAFFAVWSLVGNILAGVILYFTVPFHVNDTIEIIPDGVRGKVLAIETFYTILEDENGGRISVPNSLFFQKYVCCVKHP